jgi:hypothetical protein
MTTTVKSYTNENYYVSLEIKTSYNSNYYEVSVCERIGECECGCPINSITYSMEEKAKALATFNRYKKKYN